MNSRRSEIVGGAILSPVPELGGNGLMVRQFHIDLDAKPPRAEYYPEGPQETAQFKMAKGDSEAFLVIAQAQSGRHSWTLDIPVLVDGETFHLRADDHGAPFVTVGPEGIDAIWWDFSDRSWRPASQL